MERNEAIELGMPKYDTGRPCVFGHESPRYTINGNCCECVSENLKAKRERIKNARPPYQPILTTTTISDKYVKPALYNFRKETDVVYLYIDSSMRMSVLQNIAVFCNLVDPRFPVKRYFDSAKLIRMMDKSTNYIVMQVPIGHDETVRAMAAEWLKNAPGRAEATKRAIDATLASLCR